MKTMELSTIALLLLLVLDVASSRNEEMCHDGFYRPLLPCPGVLPLKKYYYNNFFNSCREFDYKQNCGLTGFGNEKNKFDSMEECIDTCYDVPSNSTPAPPTKDTSILPEPTMVTSVLDFATTSYMEYKSTKPVHGRSSSPLPSPSSSSSSSMYQKPPQPTTVSNTQISPVLSSSSSSSRSYSFTIIIQKPPQQSAASSSSKDHFYDQMFIYGSMIVLFLIVLSLVIAGFIFVVMYLSYRRRKRVMKSPSLEMPSSINSSSSRSDEAENNGLYILPHSGSQSSTPSEL